MCYEFLYVSNGNFVEQVNNIFEKEVYLMVCIGHLNYLYATNIYSIQRLTQLLLAKGLSIHPIEEEEMVDILLNPHTLEFQICYGDRDLLPQLKRKYKSRAPKQKT